MYVCHLTNKEETFSGDSCGSTKANLSAASVLSISGDFQKSTKAHTHNMVEHWNNYNVLVRSCGSMMSNTTLIRRYE